MWSGHRQATAPCNSPSKPAGAGGAPPATRATAELERLDTGFPALDVIRFCAALMVALYHFINVGPAGVGAAGAPFRTAFEPVAWISSSFWVAVQIFFVLSGIVIAFSADGRSAGEFVRRRALRLYPAALICATVTLLVWPKADAAARYLRSVALWPQGPWVSDVYWTMAVEITFYAMVALTLALWGSRRIVLLGGLLALLSASWWGIRIVNSAATGALQPLVDAVAPGIQLLLLRNGGFFALGILLYALRRDGRSTARILLASLAALAGLAAVISASRSMGGDAAPDALLRILLPTGLWLSAVAAMTVTLAGSHGQQPTDVRWHRAARKVGLATYPLYLVHAELGIALMLVLAPLGAVPALMIALLLVLATVALIVRLEMAIRRWFGRCFAGGRSSAAARGP